MNSVSASIDKMNEMVKELVEVRTDRPLSDEEIESVKGKYQYSIGPGFSKVFKDEHLDFFCKVPEFGK